MSFKNLSNITPVTKESTAKYEFDAYATEVKGDDGTITYTTPWIEVHPVGEVNKPYMNAVLSTQSKNRRKVTKGRMTVAMMEENREEDRKLYPQYVFSGKWGGWLDDKTGEEVPYSEEKAKELLKQMDFDEFDELRGFCNQMDNFRP